MFDSLKSPLEQFEILSVLSVNFWGLDLSITNSVLISGFSLFCFLCTLNHFLAGTNHLRVVSSYWLVLLEDCYGIITSLVTDTVGAKGQRFFPLVLSLFCFILVINLTGLVPYSYTLTSQIILTFSIASLLFIGINVVCIVEQRHLFFSLFLPKGSSLGLAFVLVPIELVSYFVRPVSLSVRLFANMMAGHTLLKVLAGFSWSMMLASGGFFFFHFIPLAILVVVMGLELGVAFIQGYVFTVLICIYLNDAVNLH